MLGWLGCWPGSKTYRLRPRAWATEASNLGLLTIQASGAAGGTLVARPDTKGVAGREQSGLLPRVDFDRRHVREPSQPPLVRSFWSSLLLTAASTLLLAPGDHAR